MKNKLWLTSILIAFCGIGYVIYDYYKTIDKLNIPSQTVINSRKELLNGFEVKYGKKFRDSIEVVLKTEDSLIDKK